MGAKALRKAGKVVCIGRNFASVTLPAAQFQY